MIECISAITLATHNMPRAVRFDRILGLSVIHGGDDAAFTSFQAGSSYLNLIAQPAERRWPWWGRVIFYHSDVDALHASLVAAGYRPDTAPRRLPECVTQMSNTSLADCLSLRVLADPRPLAVK